MFTRVRERSAVAWCSLCVVSVAIGCASSSSGSGALDSAGSGAVGGSSTSGAAGALPGSGSGATAGREAASGSGASAGGASAGNSSAAGTSGGSETQGGTSGLAGDANGGAAGVGSADVTAHLDDLKRSFLKLQFGLFHHFGILTYTGSWAQGNLPIDQFDPGSTLNPRQWAQAAKAAGAKFGVLTTRHHDGFALWPSKASSFNVGHTMWYARVGGQPAPNDRGDVVQQFVDGYRAEGLEPAFYYSIWDTTQPIQGNLNAPAVQYLTTQLTELLSNYGKVPLLIIDGWSWMMGHHAAEAAYLHDLIKSLQPDILIVDHEGLQSPYDEDLVMYEEPRGVFAPMGNTWAAVQGQKINRNGGNDWFWRSNIQNFLTVSNIVDSHINVLVPRYTNFILNCPPNDKGLLDDAIVSELKDVGSYRQSHPAPVPPALPTQGVQNSNPYFPVAATASSGNAANAIDGRNDLGSYALWQSSGSLPQWVELDLGTTKPVAFVGYLPPFVAGTGFNTKNGHCTSTDCAVPATAGIITSYEIDVSSDGESFSKAASGSWPANGKLQAVSFTPVVARYVRLIALAVNSGSTAQATELEVGGPQQLLLATPKPSDWGH